MGQFVGNSFYFLEGGRLGQIPPCVGVLTPLESVLDDKYRQQFLFACSESRY